MKSRTSLFNKTVLLKDITRFCPVWIIFAVLNIMLILADISNGTRRTTDHWLAAQLAATSASMALVTFGYAIICAFFLFGDLFKGRLCNALHALPLRRDGWFATHTLAGVLFFLVPSAAVAVICLPFMGQYWFIALMWLLACLVMYLFFFALATVCIMLTGNRFAASAVYLLINFFSMLCYWLVDTYYAPLLPGLHIRDEIFIWFGPVSMLSSAELIRFDLVRVTTAAYPYNAYKYQGLTGEWLYIGIAFGLAIALFALALVLYRKRQLESAGDFLAFRKPRPVFLVIFALAVGAIFQAIFGLFESNIVSMIIGLVIGCYAGQMLLRRTVKVFDKRSFFFCGFLACALVLTLALTYLDPLGLTRWSPESDQVASITLSDDYEFNAAEQSKYGYYNSVTITAPEDIQKVISIHQRIVAQKAYMTPNSIYAYFPYLSPVHITYHMADGRDVVRRYYVTNEALYQELKPFYSQVQFVLGYSDFEVFFSHVDSVILDGHEVSTAANARALLEAVWADCQAGRMAQSDRYYSDHYIEIQTDGRFIYLNVNNDSENTLKWIKERNTTH